MRLYVITGIYKQRLLLMGMEAFRSMAESSGKEMENDLITAQENLKKEIKLW